MPPVVSADKFIYINFSLSPAKQILFQLLGDNG